MAIDTQTTGRVNLAVKTVLDDWSDQTNLEYSSLIKNGVIRKYSNGNLYVTQRPALTLYAPSTATNNRPNSAIATGRGAYFWSALGNVVFIALGNLYAGDYSVQIAKDATASAISYSKGRMYMAELANDLVIADPYNNNSKYVPSTTSDYYDIDTPAGTDDFTNFPTYPHLAHGLAVLDNTMYALDTDGIIWNSALGDAADWSDSTFNITAEKHPDKGVYIDKHHENIVVFGSRTIQFFYDAGNPTGSPLSARPDVMYNVGMILPELAWRNKDVIYFCGVSNSGEINFYKLENFALHTIGEQSITQLIGEASTTGSANFYASCIMLGEETYYIITYSTYNGVRGSTNYTFAYNENTGTWSQWESGINEVDSFPIVSAVSFTSATASLPFLLFEDGVIASLDDWDAVTDTYILRTGTTTTSDTIHMSIISDMQDNDIRNWKIYSQLRYIGKATTASRLLYIDWSNDNMDGFASSYASNRTIDVSSPLKKLTRLGRAKSRAWKVDYDAAERIEIEGLEMIYDIGSH